MYLSRWDLKIGGWWKLKSEGIRTSAGEILKTSVALEQIRKIQLNNKCIHLYRTNTTKISACKSTKYNAQQNFQYYLLLSWDTFILRIHDSVIKQHIHHSSNGIYLPNNILDILETSWNVW